MVICFLLALTLRKELDSSDWDTGHTRTITLTLPSPGVSLILLAARSRQGGAGGGAMSNAELKLVGKMCGSQDSSDVTGAAAATVFCFFFLDVRFNFCAALAKKDAAADVWEGEFVCGEELV